MEKLTLLCREDLGSSLRRQKVETLVTIMVYLKDVTSTWRFREATDFEWQKYTRIYFNQEINNSEVRITDWNAPY